RARVKPGPVERATERDPRSALVGDEAVDRSRAGGPPRPEDEGLRGPAVREDAYHIASSMVLGGLVLSGLYACGVATATRDSTGLSTTEFAVLGLLSFGPRSGYELKKAAEAGVGYVWTAAKSHVYGVLPRLVEGGFAT